MLSVVIPAYNEEDSIGACLESFRRQTVNEPFEVIIVDNASTDKTSKVAESFDHAFKLLRVMQEPKKGRGAARATGCRAARGRLIFCSDADTQVPPEWLQKFSEIMDARPDVVAITGSCRINDCTPARNALFNFFLPLTIRSNYLMHGQPGLSGFSCVMRKEAYEKSGGFDSEADAYEDLDLSRRIRKYGKIIFRTDVPVLFSGRRFRGGLIKGLFQYVHIFIVKFIFKKRRVVLSDVR